jgi:ABC-2 type transport system permease protein
MNSRPYRTDLSFADFGTALFGWFTYGKFPIAVSRPRPVDNGLRLTPGSMVYVNLAFRWLLPALVGGFGIVLLLKRRRK